MNLNLKALIIGIVIIMLIVISGCVEEPQQDDKPVNISSPTPFFPKQSDPNLDAMNALLVGELVLVDGCLRVDDNDPDIDNYLLVWPYGFSLSTEGDVIQVIDDKGQPVARVGDRVKIGGGECVKPCEHIAKYSADLPSNRCSGPYWIVGEVVKW